MTLDDTVPMGFFRVIRNITITEQNHIWSAKRRRIWSNIIYKNSIPIIEEYIYTMIKQRRLQLSLPKVFRRKRFFSRSRTSDQSRQFYDDVSVNSKFVRSLEKDLQEVFDFLSPKRGVSSHNNQNSVYVDNESECSSCLDSYSDTSDSESASTISTLGSHSVSNANIGMRCTDFSSLFWGDWLKRLIIIELLYLEERL